MNDSKRALGGLIAAGLLLVALSASAYQAPPAAKQVPADAAHLRFVIGGIAQQRVGLRRVHSQVSAKEHAAAGVLLRAASRVSSGRRRLPRPAKSWSPRRRGYCSAPRTKRSVKRTWRAS